MHHDKFMQKAIELARQGEGLTYPNPPVGAVLVENNSIVATGWHEKSNLDHAEVVCIKNYKGQNISNCTLYITLEPCSSYGDTPPCTECIIKSGIKKIFIGAIDPNPKHNGKAIELLRNRGINVTSGVCEDEALELIKPFRKRILEGLPYITLKMAITLDGRIADLDGKSKWITSDKSREYVHQLRNKVDAIMVGSNTVIMDDPLLLPTLPKAKSPWRIIIGNNIPKNSKILNDSFADRTIIKSGDLKKILYDLSKDKGILHILCEGGSVLATSLIEEKLVDKLILFIAPKLLGVDGLPCFNLKEINMDDIFSLSNVAYKQIGNDIMVTSYLGK